ncbi:cysteine hydrolase family protein [Planomicrobium sp. YIM 101495]|uniref:cysteine hydrolase family protein n=1 Tax=Planomicrobium sp. YIM 101495 TaxID=2665160 RepID=UPI0012B9C430|nr:isochorismatase family cysteine hydrolase [Planomicrobium sp. YIM 101495]MTD29886.1 isochorismatase family protein [Planomicrobium sp. YIM 101495]
MEKALLVVDYTVDFVADDGALTCGEPGQAIEEAICSLTEEFVANGDFVVMPVDMHLEGDPYHPESALFPPHNIHGTAGRELYGRLASIYEQHKENITWMDKTRYSAFAGTNLEILLRERNIKELHLAGVCTDICVLHTAVDAYNKGFKIVVHKDAVASFNPAGHQWALSHFQDTLGADIR